MLTLGLAGMNTAWRQRPHADIKHISRPSPRRKLWSSINQWSHYTAHYATDDFGWTEADQWTVLMLQISGHKHHHQREKFHSSVMVVEQQLVAIV